MSPYLNILCVRLEKLYYTENTNKFKLWKIQPYLVVPNMCIWWSKKGDPYTKVFSCLCEVILVCYILAQLNILCSSVIKPYFTKMAIYPLFTFTCYHHFMRSPAYWIWSKQSNPYIKTFSTLSGVRSVFHITAVRYSLHKCSERILWLKRQFTVHVSPVFCALSSWKQVKLATE